EMEIMNCNEIVETPEQNRQQFSSEIHEDLLRHSTPHTPKVKCKKILFIHPVNNFIARPSVDCSQSSQDLILHQPKNSEIKPKVSSIHSYRSFFGSISVLGKILKGGWIPTEDVTHNYITPSQNQSDTITVYKCTPNEAGFPFTVTIITLNGDPMKINIQERGTKQKIEIPMAYIDSLDEALHIVTSEGKTRRREFCLRGGELVSFTKNNVGNIIVRAIKRAKNQPETHFTIKREYEDHLITAFNHCKDVIRVITNCRSYCGTTMDNHVQRYASNMNVSKEDQ
ncbi:unnamed protein product, partial [Meganyctiphanes norvegica]